MKKHSVSEEVLQKIRFSEGGTDFCGIDQEWYDALWQKRAGCGAVVAATMYTCLPVQHERLSCVKDWLPIMNEWWNFLTPGIFGLNSVKKFSFGANRFFLHNRLPYKTKIFPLSAGKYPPIERAAEFIKSGLANNCPVAFLNLNSGGVENLDSWHWVTIISLTEEIPMSAICGTGGGAPMPSTNPSVPIRSGEQTVPLAAANPLNYTVGICDCGTVLEINLSQWYNASHHFGGFAYFSK